MPSCTTCRFYWHDDDQQQFYKHRCRRYPPAQNDPPFTAQYPPLPDLDGCGEHKVDGAVQPDASR